MDFIYYYYYFYFKSLKHCSLRDLLWPLPKKQNWNRKFTLLHSHTHLLKVKIINSGPLFLPVASPTHHHILCPNMAISLQQELSNSHNGYKTIRSRFLSQYHKYNNKQIIKWTYTKLQREKRRKQESKSVEIQCWLHAHPDIGLKNDSTFPVNEACWGMAVAKTDK